LVGEGCPVLLGGGWQGG